MIPFKTLTGLLFAFLVATLPARAGQPAYPAHCIAVIDGDTLMVREPGQPARRVRLHGVDSPEIEQPFGMKARQFTARQLLDRRVTVQPVTVDAAQIPLVKIFLSGTLFNHTLVAAGYAWRYTRYLSSPQIAILERQAREARRGLWLEPHPTPPWQWRRRKAKDRPGSTDQ